MVTVLGFLQDRRLIHFPTSRPRSTENGVSWMVDHQIELPVFRARQTPKKHGNIMTYWRKFNLCRQVGAGAIVAELSCSKYVIHRGLGLILLGNSILGGSQRWKKHQSSADFLASWGLVASIRFRNIVAYCGPFLSFFKTVLILVSSLWIYLMEFGSIVYIDVYGLIMFLPWTILV